MCIITTLIAFHKPTDQAGLATHLAAGFEAQAYSHVGFVTHHQRRRLCISPPGLLLAIV